jgi:hypothetical protein
MDAQSQAIVKPKKKSLNQWLTSPIVIVSGLTFIRYAQSQLELELGVGYGV